MTLHDIAFHRSVAELIDALPGPHFWRALQRTLGQYVAHDSWVALIFSEGRPQVLAECSGDDGEPDLLFQDYLRGLYLLDPFYIASREGLLIHRSGDQGKTWTEEQVNPMGGADPSLIQRGPNAWTLFYKGFTPKD